MKLFLFILSVFTVASASAQTVIQDPNAALRSAKNFHAVEVSNGIDLYISPGDEAIAVSASTADYRDHIKISVENGVLKIWYDEDNNRIVFNNKRALKAYVSYKTLDDIKASGGSDVWLEGELKAKSFALHVSGGSDFKGKVNVDDLSVEQNGGSDVNIEGSVARLTIDASGGSDFKGYKLTAQDCSIQANGGSDVEITVTKNLTAELSGGSDVLYKGDATIKHNRSISSSVKKVG